MTVQDAVTVIRLKAPDLAPKLGLVLGSGLGGLADAIEGGIEISYDDLPGFPKPGVAGHAGSLVLGHLAGVPVACMRGRVHLYEGGPVAQAADLMRTLKGIGCTAVILTNAAGSLRPEAGPGTPCLISDHINFQGTNPLVGPNNDAVGPRFPDLTDLYDPKLRAVLRDSAAALDVAIAEGVYMAFLGPCFETPAEIRMAKILGADLVGMSTVPEAIAARHCGLKVVAISAVTNLAAGMASGPLSHEETLREGAKAGERISRILTHAMGGLADAID